MIREAELKDAESIAEIIVEAWKYAYTGIIDPDFSENMKTENFLSIMTDNINKKLETIFVYEEESLIKGFISGKLSDSKYDCETVGLYISPDYKQQGIGSKLLNRMKGFYKNKSCKTMIIWTLSGAENNIFYEKHGGKIMEKKELDIGNKSYQGAGFVFQL